MEKKTGTVSWFDAEKGFGFIKPAHDTTEIFVHHSEIQVPGFRTLDDGQRVEFEVGQGRKGPVAKKVRPL